MTLTEPWQPKVINNVLYMVARGWPAVPYSPVVPVEKRSRLMSLTLTPNNIGVPPPPPGVDRNDLPALYDSYFPAIVPADYTQNQAGARNRMIDLTEYNSPTTQEFVFPSGSGTITIQDKIVYGRWRGWPRNVDFENCIIRGPRGTISNESAMMDFDNPSTTVRSNFLDCTFAPQNPQATLNGLKGSRHKAERCHFIYCNDGDGIYTRPGSSYPTNVEWVGSRTEAHVYFPGPWYANQSPAYWDGTTYQATAAVPPAIQRKTSDGYLHYPYYDDQHKDGCHNDGIEVHGAFGSHTFDPGTQRWTGDGVYIHGNSFFTRDGFFYGTDPSGLGIPVPVVAGNPASTWVPTPGIGTRGWGDNPKTRPGPNGGQRPDMTRPVTQWAGRQIDGNYPANGSGLIILQLVNQYAGTTAVVLHDNLLDGGALGFQEQRKTFPSISFTAYDMYFGPAWFRWSGTTYSTFNQHAVRINDVGSLAAMPGVVNISGRPASHPAGAATWYSTMRWYDPADLLGGHDGEALPTTGTNGIRFF